MYLIIVLEPLLCSPEIVLRATNWKMTYVQINHKPQEYRYGYDINVYNMCGRCFVVDTIIEICLPLMLTSVEGGVIYFHIKICGEYWVWCFEKYVSRCEIQVRIWDWVQRWRQVHLLGSYRHKEVVLVRWASIYLCLYAFCWKVLRDDLRLIEGEMRTMKYWMSE